MTKIQAKQQSEIGKVGLGVMERNFLSNLADHGFQVAGYDNDKCKKNREKYQKYAQHG